MIKTEHYTIRKYAKDTDYVDKQVMYTFTLEAGSKTYPFSAYLQTDKTMGEYLVKSILPDGIAEDFIKNTPFDTNNPFTVSKETIVDADTERI